MWLGVWTKIGKAAQKRDKQEWANEKPKLDNARRLRGIYFIGPDDGEDKETIKFVRRKLEVSMEAAMPPEGLQPTESNDDAEARKDCWSSRR